MTIQDNSRAEYISRINRVMHYVDEHFCEPVNLGKLAEVANFSPFHFHRIFTAMTGETPADFFIRIRTEKAAQQLNDSTSKNVSDIAYECGFSSMSVFARTFRKHFGMSASAYRKAEKPFVVKGGVYYSKNGQPLSKKSQIYVPLNNELCSINLKQVIIMETKVVVKEMPEMKAIYCRHTGKFNEIYKAYGKLMQYACPRGLVKSDSHTLTLYHDDPAVTEIEKVRQSACLVVEDEVKTDGEIGNITIPGGKYAVGHFEILVTEFEEAWNTMCVWLTESGYEPGEGCPYEFYYCDPENHPENKFVLDICIPVKTL
ncbi:MAG: AraC family transcriptional regulator [Prolixibacteraceae bacterium]|nr:AraC family transcriptional regulator [Prolixibacteraceae bacterium]